MTQLHKKVLDLMDQNSNVKCRIEYIEKECIDAKENIQDSNYGIDNFNDCIEESEAIIYESEHKIYIAEKDLAKLYKERNTILEATVEELLATLDEYQKYILEFVCIVSEAKLCETS